MKRLLRVLFLGSRAENVRRDYGMARALSSLDADVEARGVSAEEIARVLDIELALDVDRALAGDDAPLTVIDALALDRSAVRSVLARLRDQRAPRGLVVLDDATEDASYLRAGADDVIHPESSAEDVERVLRKARALGIRRQAELDREREIVALREDVRSLRELGAAKSAFLAKASHELRTPTTAILGLTEDLLGRQRDRHEELGVLESIVENGHHLLHMLDQLLDYSKLESGRVEVEQIPCSPREIVVRISRLLEPLARKKGLSFQVLVAEAIPDEIVSDPLRIERILVNFVSNAIKFTDVGGVRINVTTSHGDEGKFVAFSVTDSGIGMTPDQLERLFTAHAREATSTPPELGATGIGLSISRELASLLDGDVTASSQRGVGSELALRIPLRTPSACSESGKSTQEPIRGAPGSNSTVAAVRRDDVVDPGLDLRGERILIVDDNPMNQQVLARALRSTGASLTIVDDGSLAVDEAQRARARERPFAAILMDVHMPDVDGYQATRLIRANGDTTPIIAVTASAAEADRRRCLTSGCDFVLVKPYRRERLLALLDTYLGERSRAFNSSK